MKYLLPLFPPFAAFGPLFLIMGADEGWTRFTPFLGAIMTSLALFTLFGLLARHHRALESGRLEEA